MLSGVELLIVCACAVWEMVKKCVMYVALQKVSKRNAVEPSEMQTTNVKTEDNETGPRMQTTMEQVNTTNCRIVRVEESPSSM